MKFIYLLSIFCLFTSCGSSNELYSWGKYDKIVYQFYSDPGDKSTLELKQTYIEMIRKAKKKKKPIPPGICADYGYLLLKDGFQDVAQKYFEMEVALYPESTVFIQQILKRTNESN
ncbi:MAG: DUF4810 domain-containing protein [Tannerellaceae bacterium]